MLNTLVRLVLVLGLAVSISCSRGGGDDSEGGGDGSNNFGKPQGAGGSVVGQWEGNGFTLVITQNTVALVAECAGGKIIQAQSKATITPNTITILENKSADGGGNCNISLTKGSNIKYSVNGNTLTATVDGQTLQFTRAGGQDNGGQNNGGNQGGGDIQADAVMFTEANCGGQTIAYNKGMNCAQLKGKVLSVVHPQLTEGQCLSFEQTADASAVCQYMNQQTGQ